MTLEAPSEASNIDTYGENYLWLVAGNNQAGILKMENTLDGRITYMKFKVATGETEIGNRLKVKYFDDLVTAQSDQLDKDTVEYIRRLLVGSLGF